jgi:hypothetical protein
MMAFHQAHQYAHIGPGKAPQTDSELRDIRLRARKIVFFSFISVHNTQRNRLERNGFKSWSNMDCNNPLYLEPVVVFCVIMIDKNEDNISIAF